MFCLKLFLSYFCLVAAAYGSSFNIVHEESVSLISSLDGAMLSGTLSMSKTQSYKGIVLMIVGSGKADRDETVPANMTSSGRREKLFVQVSNSLVHAGFITFRCDKRGVSINADGSTNVDMAIWATADRSHLIADAIDEAKFLTRLFPDLPLLVLGHSEGTTLAPFVAKEVSIRGLLLLGVVGSEFRQLLHFQMVDSPTLVESHLSRLEREQEYNEALKFLKTTNEIFAPDGKPVAWYRQYLEAPSNASILAEIKAPVAIFQGEDDIQTPLCEALNIQKVRPVLLNRYYGLGHGFSKRKKNTPTLGPIAQLVLDDIAFTALQFVF